MRTLKELAHTTKSGNYVMPSLVESVKAICTLGEMNMVFKECNATFEELRNVERYHVAEFNLYYQ